MVAVLRLKGSRGFALAGLIAWRASAAARLGRCAWVRALAMVAGAIPLIGCTTPASGPSTGDGDTRAAALPMDGYVRLERGAHPLARPGFDLGPLDPNRRIANLSVVFKLSPEQQIDRDALIAAQLDRSSPSYRKWLTPEQYADRFGAKAQDIARTRAWLARQGLDVRSTSRLGARVSFAGRVADLQKAFRTEMHTYKVGSEIHYAMSTAPAIPAELSDIVLAVHNTHDFHARTAQARMTTVPDAVCPTGDKHCLAGFGLAPRDWATIYDVTPLYATGVTGSPLDGSGTAIAIVGVSQIVPNDVVAFRTTYGLPASTLTEWLVPDTGVAAWFAGAATEAILDTEWSRAIAPGASIQYVFTGSDDANIDSATYYAIEQNMAPILSQSAGACELNQAPSDADVLGVYGSAANLLGITFLAASGDAAAAGCIEQFGQTGLYVQFPASFPGVTAVGGTEFPTHSIAFDCNGFATGYALAEQVWNETNPNMGPPNGGGGGISAVFPRAPYQSTTCAIVGSLPVPLPAGMTPSSMRQVPDIALSASADRIPYFIECTPVSGTTDCSATGGHPVVLAVGGTSAATPSFAGVLALVDEAIGGRLGNVNPELYALYTTAPSAFHDITAGNNLVGCTRGPDPGCPTTCPVQGFPQSCYGYQAAAGYDCASGLGSIDAANLVRAWAQVAPTTTALTAVPSTVAEGSGVNFTATVDAGASTPARGGTVTFTFQSYGPYGLIWSDSLGGPIAVSSPGTATVTTGAPPAAVLKVGLVRPGAQYVGVSAAYGGDAHHLASTSPVVRVWFTGVDLCIPQGSANVAPDATIAYSSSGGIAPIAWYTSNDSTCDENGDCSLIDGATGAFTAGPEPGYVVVAAYDSFGAIAVSWVTVGTPGGTPPWGALTPTSCPSGDGGETEDAESSDDAGATQDATDTEDDASSVESGADTGSVVAFDGWPSSPCESGASLAESDAQGDSELGPRLTTPASGCGCIAAGRESAPGGMLGAVALGLGWIARRRRAPAGAADDHA